MFFWFFLMFFRTPWSSWDRTCEGSNLWMKVQWIKPSSISVASVLVCLLNIKSCSKLRTSGLILNELRTSFSFDTLRKLRLRNFFSKKKNINKKIKEKKRKQKGMLGALVQKGRKQEDQFLQKKLKTSKKTKKYLHKN